MGDDERIEYALDEADETATATQERLIAAEVFRQFWKILIEKQKQLCLPTLTAVEAVNKLRLKSEIMLICDNITDNKTPVTM